MFSIQTTNIFMKFSANLRCQVKLELILLGMTVQDRIQASTCTLKDNHVFFFLTCFVNHF